MNIKCPCCGDCFAPNEDYLRWDYSEDINYNDSEKFVWDKSPLLRSSLDCNNNDIKKEQILKEKDSTITGENH